MLSGDTHWHYFRNRAEFLGEEVFIHGEGCTAILLEKGNNNIHISLHSDGSGYKYLFHPLGGARNAWRPTQKALLPNGVECILPYRANYMDGLEITAFSTTTVVNYLRGFLDSRNESPDDYDGLVLHQANLQIIKTIANRLKFKMDKVPVSLDRYANTSGASLPMTIADAYAGLEKNKLSLLTCAFGIGLSWGIASFEIDPTVIEPIFSYDGLFEEGFVKPINE
jgi:3-oxoacyl-[acyl-carrier-protein] synthase-3